MNERVPDFKGFLHSHPQLECIRDIPENHVVVDKKDWEALSFRFGIKRSSDSTGFAHRHPLMESKKDISGDHVIIDREEWLLIRKDCGYSL